MRTVEQIQAELRDLPVEERQRIRDFLDDLVEDELEFTDEFKAKIQESVAEMNAGIRPRVRQP